MDEIKIPYDVVKKELKKRRKNITHFNKEFYELYCEADKERKRNVAEKIDDSYTALLHGNKAIFRHCFDKVRETNFYRKNGGAYCEFLEVMYQLSPKTSEIMI